MNVVPAAPAAPARAARSCSPVPAPSDDFASLLAGLGRAEPTAAGQAHVDAAATAPTLQGEDDQAQAASDGGGLLAPPAVPVLPPPVVEVPAVDTAVASAAVTSPPPATGSAVDGPAPRPVDAGAAPATGAADLRPAPSPHPTASAAAAPVVVAQAASDAAPAVRSTTGATAPSAVPPSSVDHGAVGGTAAVLPSTAVPAGLPAELSTGLPAEQQLAPSGLAPTTPPEALELSVPADVAGDTAVPALDVRSTASPAAPVAAAQTAGTAVVDAVLPADTASAGPVDVPIDAPGDEAATAVPAAATGAGAAAPQPADLRTAAPAPAPAPPPPPATPPPATQVVQLLAPVLTGPDGSWSLSLQLYPEELGAVQVEVLLRGGEIRLALHAPDEAAQAALRSALPDLRADLAAGGLSATSLTVDDGRAGSSSDRSAERSPDRRQDGQGDAPGRRPHPYRDAEPAPRPSPSHADAALDLRM